MGSNKIAVILDESKIFLDKKTGEIIEKWGLDKKSCRTLKEWTKDSGRMISMFDEPFVRLDLCEDVDLKNFVQLITNREKNNFFNEKDWYGKALIITVDKQKGTKKIVDLVNEFNGIVIQKKTTEEHKKELINELKLSNDLKEIVSDYIGENYEEIYSVIDSINSIKDKNTITIDNIYTFLPSKPGSVPPWNYVNALYGRDVGLAHRELDRVLQNTHPLIILKLLKNSINNLYLYLYARQEGYYGIKNIANALKLSNQYVLINASKTRNDLKIEVAEYLLEEICYLEYLIKNGTVIDINELLHVYTSRIMAALIANTTQLKNRRRVTQ